ncbi:hypothetical protein [Nitrospira sp. Nam74]
MRLSSMIQSFCPPTLTAARTCIGTLREPLLNPVDVVGTAARFTHLPLFIVDIHMR